LAQASCAARSLRRYARADAFTSEPQKGQALVPDLTCRLQARQSTRVVGRLARDVRAVSGGGSGVFDGRLDALPI